MNAALYSLHLSASLRTVSLTHSLWDVINAVALIQEEHGHATIPQVHRALGVTYNNICLHLLRNESLFDEMPGSAPRRFKLSPSAIDLMARVKAAVDRRHRAHSLPTAPAGT